MSFKKITENVSNITLLADQPSLSATLLKKEFDKGNETIKKAFNNQVDDLNEFVENIASEYNNTLTYKVGDYCMYENKLYKCITEITTAESFDSNKWEDTTVFDEIKIKNQITSGGETKAGYQIDGKDVYVKRYFISALPNNQISYYNHNLNINDVKFVKYDGFAYTDDTYIMMSYYNPKSATSSLGLYLTNTQIAITTSANFSSFQATIDIYYTYR